MPDLWEILSSRELLRVGGRLTVSEHHIRLPDGREVDDYLNLAMPPFVMIVAQTQDGFMICERQYKHGPRQIILTLPAGSIENGETPIVAAKRELLEETGYASPNWAYLASRVTHANAGGSVSHVFVARECHKVAEPDSGDLEDMTIELLPPGRLLEAIAGGEVALMADAAALLPGLMALGILVPASP